MENQTLLPAQDMVQRLLLGLLDRNVGMKRLASPIPWVPGTPGVVGTYIRDDGSLWALWVCDLPLAAGAASALTLIPTDTLGTAVKAGRLTGDMIENVREIINVAASLFNQTDMPHVRLETVHTMPGVLPNPVAAMLSRPRRRLDLDVTVAGYGGGKMSLLGY